MGSPTRLDFWLPRRGKEALPPVFSGIPAFSTEHKKHYRTLEGARKYRVVDVPILSFEKRSGLTGPTDAIE